MYVTRSYIVHWTIHTHTLTWNSIGIGTARGQKPTRDFIDWNLNVFALESMPVPVDASAKSEYSNLLADVIRKAIEFRALFVLHT